ncbi:purine-nucleoside phosphorylase [Dissulfurirhabdus thermomarina]|uniref:Purine nucleoside phosphorylase n=1 Tax=Dissulfurirhabdus thermomarina TaxID=1765737 RepID=A0A6N9TX95_DISTH|nr:purine-nucleoside phosphorylase [Dissulfurirhabdus thermomarina]NDY43106.1 purine-nucleoside phosphorylase [Dissulfurirhabdus thermomarina]NMX24452.1 purine-nucleoside phosphorylase [Dissulfurirhabdus thermomarina]
MDQYSRAVTASVDFFRKALPERPDVCLMLGTGLDGAAASAEVLWEARYDEIPAFPAPTAPEHPGRVRLCRLGGTVAAIFQGRYHYYEGHAAREAALPVRVMGLVGARTFIGCNAAGGLDTAFRPGDLMVLRDHINLIPDNPLRGPNRDDWGPRFPDMSRAYDAALRARTLAAASELGIPAREGVFVAVPGPSLETPAETRFLRLAGADAVAMSLVPEVIVAVHAGMRVLGISVIANVNDPDDFTPIRLEDVVEGARSAQDRLGRLLSAVLPAAAAPGREAAP